MKSYINPFDPIFRTYTMTERFRRMREDFCMLFGRRIPRRVRYWVIIQAWADAAVKNPAATIDANVGQLLDTVDDNE